MSERDKYEDVALREFLERIAKKVENSPALNGGWDKLVVTLDNIKEKQEETGEKVNKIHNALYEPDEGFFARVRTIEHETEIIKEKISEHTQEDKRFYEELKKNNEENKLSSETKNSVARLHEVAGKNLEELVSVVKIRQKFEKMFWLIAAGACSVIGKVLWDIIVNR